MEDERRVTRSITDELHSWDIQRDQMEGKSGLTRSIIDALHFSDIKKDQAEMKVVLLEVSLTSSFFGSPRRSNGR